MNRHAKFVWKFVKEFLEKKFGENLKETLEKF